MMENEKNLSHLSLDDSEEDQDRIEQQLQSHYDERRYQIDDTYSMEEFDVSEIEGKEDEVSLINNLDFLLVDLEDCDEI